MSTDMDRMSGGEKFLASLFALVGWWCVGVVVVSIGDASGLLPDNIWDQDAAFIGTVMLWPLFAIKFLAIGVWAVLSSGFELLV